MEQQTYTTIQGDAWDAIAQKVYGDTKYTGWLMQNNLPLLDVFVFGAGTILRTPDVPESNDSETAPSWRDET